jgi:hypothetical protein
MKSGGTARAPSGGGIGTMIGPRPPRPRPPSFNRASFMS